ncbi:hypothetical protein [Clostridium uliginosum]|uniref:Uncharacterized protein n=1 Tax=Clostridium uliginosum TaxID=119641 RepID=A0A1I1RE32_9CLOT|nr:hypothetical protein [Clostridium uliginosum]SFD32621.1 hypothetical protein SAMN05421842_13243 [Clostridium uliginosum]
MIAIWKLFSRADLQKQIDADLGLANLLGSDLTDWIGYAADLICKNAIVSLSVMILKPLLKADASEIASTINSMVSNHYNYIVVTYTYEYQGYLPGSSYPNYNVIVRILDKIILSRLK